MEKMLKLKLWRRWHFLFFVFSPTCWLTQNYNRWISWSKRWPSQRVISLNTLNVLRWWKQSTISMKLMEMSILNEIQIITLWLYDFLKIRPISLWHSTWYSQRSSKVQDILFVHWTMLLLHIWLGFLYLIFSKCYLPPQKYKFDVIKITWYFVNNNPHLHWARIFEA